jgi:hypothetical protein
MLGSEATALTRAARPGAAPGRQIIKDDEKSGYQRAADDAADLDRLLPGEDSRSKNLDDVRHWVQVYTELVSFKHDLLRSTYEHLAEMQKQDARGEVRGTDELVLEAEAKRFERRLEFWEGRSREVSEE